MLQFKHEVCRPSKYLQIQIVYKEIQDLSNYIHDTQQCVNYIVIRISFLFLDNHHIEGCEWFICWCDNCRS